MGVNANFQADFSTWHNAVDLAIVKLADFGKGAEDVEQKLNNMVDKWSGRKIIQDADALLVVINKVGGATALTTTEQIKLNATLQEAIAKYKVIGEQVPPELQKLADQTKALADASKSTKDSAGGMEAGLIKMATAAAAAFSVQAITQYVGKLIDGASALNTLSAQTHINVEDLQVLAAATSSYGVNADELGRALFALQAKINGGDQSVVSAYADMGISIDQIKGKNAYDLFMTTERALGQLHGGIRDAAAADLYGGKLGSSMAAFSEGVDKAVDDAKRLNVITSEESVKAMAEYGDALARAKSSIDAFVTEGLGKLAQGFNVLNNAVNNGASKWDLFWAGFKDSVGLSGNLTKVLDDVNKKLEEQARVADAAARASGQHKEALTAEARAAQFMATLTANATKELTDQQRKDLDILRERNELNAQNAERIGVTVSQLNNYKAAIEAAKKAQDDLKKAIADADAIAMDTYQKQIKTLEVVTQSTLKAYSYTGQISQLEALKRAEEDLARSVYGQIESEKVRMKVLDDLSAKRAAIDVQEQAIQQRQMARVNEQVIAELDARTKIMESYGQQADGTLKIEDAAQKLQKALDDLHAKKQEGIDQTEQENLLQDQYLKDINGSTAGLNDNTEATNRNTDAHNKNADATGKATGKVDAFGNTMTSLTKITTELGTSIVPVNMHWDQLQQKLVANEGPHDKLNALMGITKKETDAASQSLDKYTGSIQMAAAASKSLADQMDSYFPQGTNGSARLFMYGGDTAGEAAYKASGGIISAPVGGGILHRAAGGPVDAGAPYMVGERGPELFVPSTPGSIMPNGSGGISVTVNVNGSVLGTPGEIARVVGGAFMSVLRSQGTRLPVGAVGS